MGEVIELYQVRRRRVEDASPEPLLQPMTIRDRVVDAIWLAIGIPLSLGILVLQLWPFVGRHFFLAHTASTP